MTVHGVSLGHRGLAEADHWIRSLAPPPVLACTHLVRVPFPHVAISLVGPHPAADAAPSAPELLEAAALAATGGSGRAVIFPGVQRLVGVLTVGEVLALSAIDRIEVLGGEPPDESTPLDTGDFVRPQWRDGELVLTVTPAAGGRLVPFESQHPTACCAGH